MQNLENHGAVKNFIFDDLEQGLKSSWLLA
jgi:hypothetical protein